MRLLDIRGICKAGIYAVPVTVAPEDHVGSGQVLTAITKLQLPWGRWSRKSRSVIGDEVKACFPCSSQKSCECWWTSQVEAAGWENFHKKQWVYPIFLMICTKEDNTKTISASRHGSRNGGARQELWSYLNSLPTREKAVPTSHWKMVALIQSKCLEVVYALF